VTTLLKNRLRKSFCVPIPIFLTFDGVVTIKSFRNKFRVCSPLVKESDDGISWIEASEKNRETYKVLDLYYLTNERIMSCWIGGPNGWCDWDGTIGCNNKNIGKWPDVEAVAAEWGLIAEAFPFLNLRCQLFDGETCEEDAKPILLFTVANGRVVVEDSVKPIGSFVESDFRGFFFKGAERGITIPELKKKIKMVYQENKEDPFLQGGDKF